MNNLKKPSRQITKLLRHKPQGLTMDKQAYVLVTDLITKLNITIEELNWIVENDDKYRFSFNADKTKIRANQGHSIKGIDIQMTPIKNKDLLLYHGTSKSNLKLIMQTGFLKSMKRQYVHLSGDKETAIKVGLRHAKKKEELVILFITSRALINNKIKLFISDNGVYQSDDIPFSLIDNLND